MGAHAEGGRVSDTENRESGPIVTLAEANKRWHGATEPVGGALGGD